MFNSGSHAAVRCRGVRVSLEYSSLMQNVTSERRCGCAQRPSTATMPRVHVLSASPTGVPSVSLAATGWHTSVNRHTPISRRPYGNGYQTLVRCSGGSVISPRADRIQIAQYFPVVLTGTVLLRIRISRPAASDGHLKGYPAIFLHARYSSKLDMTATTPLRRSMSLGRVRAACSRPCQRRSSAAPRA